MGEQLDIFGPGAIPTESTRAEDRRARAAARRPKSIDQRFAEFHDANPHIANELLRLARARLDRGETRIGLKALWEELRQSLITTEEGGMGTEGPANPYKLNNDFTALYARMLVRMDPRLEGVIEMRRRKNG